jgi:integrase
MNMQTNITTRKKDKGWQYIISYKDDSSGKWKQTSKQGFRGSREAKAAADKALEDLKDELEEKAKLNIKYEDITFKDYKEKYIERQRLYKEGATIESYKSSLGKFSKLYDKPIKEINNDDIQECIDEMIKQRLCISSIKTYLGKLNVFLNDAVDRKAISKNPIEKIIMPKEKSQEEKRALTLSEYEDLLRKLKNRKYYIMSLLAGSCGLRLGEILGLTWDDIDLKNNTIIIRQQLKVLSTGDIGIGDVKSDNSDRIVPINPKISKRLTTFKLENPIRTDKRIIPFKNPRSTSSNMKRAFKKIGYDISIHELRHTYATLILSNGVDYKTAAGILGHDVKVTMSTYSHVTDDTMAKAKEKINKIFNF